ncbi:rhomboid family intramembrane serine protease [Pedobacter aquatilis]|uniref:rhomboid family intramembrane serine protease n=1 Tax=Pedobacter aquatilis TaxID=351343 RepID=UPI0025B4726E|nr:rhomboid family intramembrane serine protease [Pedobacter aquatilis]MDN3585186.1 rhomboid family intramembrane serine protease [Pedobacter aquatilis]
MNNNNVLKDLSTKVFRSGNPVALYIGINIIIFIATALIALITFFSGSKINIYEMVRTYLALPAAFSSFPDRFYTIVTYMFFHADFFHILFNMIALFWFGQIFMNFLKMRQFHFIFWAGGLAGALVYLLGLNLIPVFSDNLAGASVIGSSAAVMAIITATATLVPNYGIFLMFLGEVKIKYLAIAYFILDILSLGSANAGGSFAHIGGAILGFVFIKRLQSGNDWSKIFEKKPKLRVVKNEQPVKKPEFKGVSQKEVDEILDKISKSGYDKLTATEKEKLFKASKD